MGDDLHSGGRQRARIEAARDHRTFAALATGAAVLLGVFAWELRAQTAAAPEPAVSAPGSAVGVNLNITPKRLTFKKGERSATVYVFNQGSSPATFDISMVDRIMLPTGDIVAASDAQSDPAKRVVAERLRSAKDMVLFTPRRATLAPGKGQTIRIRLSPPAGGEAAEYRSHLTVTTIPPRDLGVTAEDVVAARQNELAVRITSVFGLSIPVIVRSGDVSSEGAIENVRFTSPNISLDGIAPARPTPVLSFDIQRRGNNSLFGNIEVRAKGSSKEPIGLMRGVGVYTETDRRRVQIPLTRAPAAGEQLEISFVDDDITPGRLVARTSFVRP